MKSSHGRSTCVAGILALALAGAPSLAQTASRGSAPEQAPRILITNFHSVDRTLGVESADAVRYRVQRDHSPKELFVHSKTAIKDALESQGYPPDSALTAFDLIYLATSTLRSEYVFDGKAERAGPRGGARLTTRLWVRAGNQDIAEWLPPAEGKTIAEAARLVARSITDALKGMKAFNQCIGHLRAAKLDDAIASANAGIAAYAPSVLARICLLGAYEQKDAPPDSIIRLANRILAADSTSLLALWALSNAYRRNGDRDKSIEINTRIYRMTPSPPWGPDVTEPARPKPNIDSLINSDPTDPSMIRRKWERLMIARRFKDAIATGEKLARIDTAAATFDFHAQQIEAALQIADTLKLIEVISTAAQKFPTNVTFPMALAHLYRQTGQLQEASHADAAMLDILVALSKKATESGARHDWEDTRLTSGAVDVKLKTTATKYYLGLASFEVGRYALRHAETLASDTTIEMRDKRADVCVEAKVVEEMWANASRAMSAGGDHDRGKADSITSAIVRQRDRVTRLKQRYCRAN